MLGVWGFKQPGDKSSQKYWCDLIAAARTIINMDFHHLTSLYRRGRLDLECPHQITQHLHRRPHGTLTWTLVWYIRQNNREVHFGRAALTEGGWVQGLVWGYSMAPTDLFPAV